MGDAASRGLRENLSELFLRRELVAHCDGPSRTDDVTILCVDRL